MPVHVAITRRVLPGCEAEFQQSLREFFQTSFAHDGVLGATMIVPAAGFGFAEVRRAPHVRDRKGTRRLLLVAAVQGVGGEKSRR